MAVWAFSGLPWAAQVDVNASRWFWTRAPSSEVSTRLAVYIHTRAPSDKVKQVVLEACVQREGMLRSLGHKGAHSKPNPPQTPCVDQAMRFKKLGMRTTISEGSGD